MSFLPAAGLNQELSIYSVSSGVALALKETTDILLTNQGPGVVYVKLTQSSLGANAASTSDMPILPNDRVIINMPPTTTWVAGICPTSYTATLSATLGWER